MIALEKCIECWNLALDMPVQNIYFHHEQAIEEGKELFLNISIELINKRMSGIWYLFLIPQPY